MKLWAMLCMATQVRWIMVESSDKMWSTGEWNGKSLQDSCLENPMNSMQRQKIGHWKMASPGQLVPNVLLEISGEINPERQRFGRFAEKASNKLKIW